LGAAVQAVRFAGFRFARARFLLEALSDLAAGRDTWLSPTISVSKPTAGAARAAPK
jgi:hypothetical protein